MIQFLIKHKFKNFNTVMHQIVDPCLNANYKINQHCKGDATLMNRKE
jgi:hypothetical protein